MNSVYLITQARISKYYITTHKKFSEHEPSRCSSSPANISPKYLKQPRSISPTRNINLLQIERCKYQIYRCVLRLYFQWLSIPSKESREPQAQRQSFTS